MSFPITISCFSGKSDFGEMADETL